MQTQTTETGRRRLGLPRRLLPREATEAQLGLTLAFVAGAINAGGFMIVGQYTSHMSGVAAAVADHLALGLGAAALAGLLALLSFMAGRRIRPG